MGFLNICGFETGDGSEFAQVFGSASVQTTTKRTGSYAGRVNSSFGGFRLKGLAATGVVSNLGRTTATYYAFYFRPASFPSSNVPFASIYNATLSGTTVTLNVDNSGNVTLVGSTTSPTIATLSTGTWYLVEVKIISNGTCEARIDAGTSQTCTGNNITQDLLQLGCPSTASQDFYYDDAAIRDDDWVGAGEVRAIRPNGTGTENIGWAEGTGTTFSEVDDTPHDSDTTYIKATTAPSTRNYSLTDAATAGITGSVGVVKFWGITRNEGGSPEGHIRFGKTSISGSTTTSTACFPSSYGFIAAMSTLASTPSDVDELIVGIALINTSVAARCTALGAMVWSTGQAPPVEKTATFDAALADRITKTATFDAALADIVAKTLDIDAATANRLLETVDWSATLADIMTKTATLDASLADLVTKTATWDAVIFGEQFKTATLDAVIAALFTRSTDWDAVAADVRSGTMTFDASITARTTVTADWAALLAAVATATLTFDTDLRRTHRHRRVAAGIVIHPDGVR